MQIHLGVASRSIGESFHKNHSLNLMLMARMVLSPKNGLLWYNTSLASVDSEILVMLGKPFHYELDTKHQRIPLLQQVSEMYARALLNGIILIVVSTSGSPSQLDTGTRITVPDIVYIDSPN